MKINLKIEEVQHIKLLEFEIDSSSPGIVCLAGKNSTGKTTLIKSFLNLYQSDTFKKTASPYIFSDKSKITISFDDKKIIYTYNKKLGTIDSKQLVPREIKEFFLVELPMPHGTRFKHFQKLSDIDESLRTEIALSNYFIPEDLITFLSRIYKTERFKNLRSANINGEYYYFILLEEKYYIREDYLSSGEYFVINLFRSIKKNKRIIIIDEIDVSLDASAQVNLVQELRKLCYTYSIKIIFTTHSLPLMKTLEKNELYYIQKTHESIVTTCRSYNYIKSVLFGFSGWDKYVLTEDRMLESYLHHSLSKINITPFMEYKIIPIGGANQVIELTQRNSLENFLADPHNILCVLDGDQSEKYIERNDLKVQFIPFESIEKAMLDHYESGALPDMVFTLAAEKRKAKASELLKKIIKSRKMTLNQIFDFLDHTRPEEAETFRSNLFSFLNSHE